MRKCLQKIKMESNWGNLNRPTHAPLQKYVLACTHTHKQTCTCILSYTERKNASCRFTTCDIHLDDLVLKGPIFKKSFGALAALAHTCCGIRVKVRGQLQTLVSFFYSGPRYWTQAIEFGFRHLYPLSSIDASWGLIVLSTFEEFLKTSVP